MFGLKRGEGRHAGSTAREIELVSALLLNSRTGVSYLIPTQALENWQLSGEQQAELTQLVGAADVAGFGAGESFLHAPQSGAPPFAGCLVVLPAGSLARRPGRQGRPRRGCNA